MVALTDLVTYVCTHKEVVMGHHQGHQGLEGLPALLL